MSIKAQELYHKLLELYGPQGWWPLINKSSGVIEYGSHSQPLGSDRAFEVGVGAILTQNTQFDPNVTVALGGLFQLCKKNITPQAVLDLELDSLRLAIRSAGYFRQKSDYLRSLARFFLELGSSPPRRSQILRVKGVGPETADTILLYAFNQPFFIVDTYTRRTLVAQNLIDPNARYVDIQTWFMEQLPPDPQMFNEYHALLVAHGKQRSFFIN